MNYPAIHIYPSPNSENSASPASTKPKSLPAPVIQLSKSINPKLEIVPEEKEGLVSHSSIPDSLAHSTPKASSHHESTFSKEHGHHVTTLSGLSPDVRSKSTRDLRGWKTKESVDSLTDLFGHNKPKIDHIPARTLKRSRSSILYSKSEELKATHINQPETNNIAPKPQDQVTPQKKKGSFFGNMFKKFRKNRAAQEDQQPAQKYVAPSSAAGPNSTDLHYAPSMSNYPAYKIDKRLIFMGQEPDLPWHVISYNSTFRKLWDLFILALILYETFWYPLVISFITYGPWPRPLVVIEVISIFIFILDILINMRTTYSNENNEEIIDSAMMRQKYTRSKRFIADFITVLPVQEILLMCTYNSDKRWLIYSSTILIRLIRVYKVSSYMQNRFEGLLVKLFRIFIAFFMLVHWVSCIWYLIIEQEYEENPQLRDLWVPNNQRMITTDDGDLLTFYTAMHIPKVYGFTLISVFMLAIGSDMAPITDLQIWLSVLIGLFGAAILAYRAGVVILTINKSNKENALYQDQLEELKYKLKVKKIPHNLKVKVMEYFYYSWRKHNVLKKLDDFSELSRPLQRDIALYQYHEMIMKVPLFKELDPAEILSIIKKLKTSIYMPGDKIIRAGEKGTEMFIIQEGVAEMLIDVSAGKKGDRRASKPRYQKSFLTKGSYFGEVALMTNSKRTFDVTAYEFCILLSLSKADYNRLKTEFSDIGPRLKSGLKHYKNTHMESLIQILKNLNVFQNFTEKELSRIADEYLEEIFVDPDKVILGPKSRTNAMYIMLEGMINCYEDDDETRNYLSNLKRSDAKDNWTIVDEDGVDCLDDDILKLEKDKLSMEDQKEKLNLVNTYTYGEYFGTLDFDINEVRCDKFFVSDSGCQLGVITQALKSQMAAEDPVLYAKLRENFIRYSPKRTIPPIEEESDSSFGTKNNTIIKTKITRPGSKTEFGKKPVLIKISTQNKEEDYMAIKEELQQLEDEVNNFTMLLASLNARINKTPTHVNLERNSLENIPEKLQPSPKINILPAKAAESDEFLQILQKLEEQDQAVARNEPVESQ